MAVRLKDIAAELGVSVMTVSKVLRNEGRISEPMRARVLQRVKELNYRPNLTARSLISGRSFQIGLVVPDLMHSFFAALSKHVAKRVRAEGYGLAISSSEENPDIERDEIAAFLSRGVDALILASSQRSAASKTFTDLTKDGGVPLVLADRLIKGLNTHFVGSDDRTIGVLATEHLVKRGYQHIAHIGRSTVSTGMGRRRGYEQTLKHFSRKLRPDLIVEAQSADEEGEQSGLSCMRQLLSLEQPPDAVFCYNDIVAYGALKALADAKVRVPKDFGVVGVSNLASLSFWDASPVALTTIDQNIPVLAERLAELTLELIQRGRRPQPAHVIVAPKLIKRGST